MIIWKWPLVIADRQTVRLPLNAKILTVQAQNEQPQLWAWVDNSELAVELRTIAIYGTGNHIPKENMKYISTFQLLNGSIIFHAFELE